MINLLLLIRVVSNQLFLSVIPFFNIIYLYYYWSIHDDDEEDGDRRKEDEIIFNKEDNTPHDQYWLVHLSL